MKIDVKKVEDNSCQDNKEFPQKTQQQQTKLAA
jgi:hypothetical protein